MDYSQKFIDAFKHLQRWEGGSAYTDKSFDGHNTRWGIIEETYQQFYPHKPVKECTEEQALYIYYTLFWRRNRLDEVNNNSLAEFIFQGVVNMGNAGFIKNCLQLPLNLVVDGIIGRNTLGKLNDHPQDSYNKVYQATKERYEKIANNGKQKFLKGWMNRINDFNFKYNE